MDIYAKEKISPITNRRLETEEESGASEPKNMRWLRDNLKTELLAKAPANVTRAIVPYMKRPPSSTGRPDHNYCEGQQGLKSTCRLIRGFHDIARYQ